MGSDLARRVAKLSQRKKSSEAVILPTLPGMTWDEGMRLWFGADRASWPPNDPEGVRVVNGLQLHSCLDDVPSEFMEERGSMLFDVRWKRLCDAFDDHRQQVWDVHGTGLMERVAPAGEFSAMYRPVDIPFKAPASVN